MRLVSFLFVALSLLAGCARHADNGLASSSTASCTSCHTDHGAEFARSRHAAATRSPVFEAMLPRVEASWGSLARARCESCHAPPHGDDQAIGCVSCHAAVGNRGAHDGRIVLDVDAPVLGSIGVTAAPHATRTSGLLGASDLCASCHEVSGPNLFVEHTGSEHALAVEQTGAPACARCHVPAGADAPIANGGIARARHDHRFVGVDPAWEGDDAARAEAAEASRALVSAALELRFVDGTLELENVGAAHAVPTGVTFFRDLWVDLVVTHADGRVERLARVITLGDRPMRGTAPVALPTDADHVEENRLAPFEIRRVALAPDVTHAEATLRMQPFRTDALEALGIDPARAPAIDVTRVER